MLSVTLAVSLLVAAADKPRVVELWPGPAPGVIAATSEEKDQTKAGEGLVAGRRVIRLGNVSKPTLTIYKPTKERDTGTCVIVCPGGGYHILALDLEGTEVCEWLNTLGITAVLLKYRVPRPKTGLYYLPALMDAQRALSITRHHAAEWKIDPNKIGILGFSAGGSLAALASTNWDKRAYEAVDKLDAVSCRPDFAVLVYPGYLADKSRTKLADEYRVTKETPPTLLVHAHDDPVTSESSALMYLALKKAGVPAELHVWETGGHGYGLRRTDQPVTRWPERAEEWFRQRGLLPKAPRFEKLDTDAVWNRLPLRGPDQGKPLPDWARTLAGPLPATTAAMLELDRLHREANPLGASLSAKVRYAAAVANQCEWTKMQALNDLRRAGLSDPTATNEDERRILRFARTLTLAAYSVSDDEIEQLRKQLGEAKLVALVKLLAYANFQDRLVLSLGVSGPVLPSLNVQTDPSDRSTMAPKRLKPIDRPTLSYVERPDWEPIDFAELMKSMESQKARSIRIPTPSQEILKERASQMGKMGETYLRLKWMQVCQGYQPELTNAWMACTRAYSQEAHPDRVFNESVFWVINRSISCFY